MWRVFNCGPVVFSSKIFCHVAMSSSNSVESLDDNVLMQRQYVDAKPFSGKFASGRHWHLISVRNTFLFSSF